MTSFLRRNKTALIVGGTALWGLVLIGCVAVNLNKTICSHHRSRSR